MKPKTTWNDEQWSEFSEWLTTMLKNVPEVTVSFSKKDGTTRVMKCTLLAEKLPLVEAKEDKTDRKKSTTSIAVYDLELNAWRSFITKQVTNVTFDV